MAKSARSSTKKANRAILRRDVFGPPDEQRKQRLYEKTMASIASAQDNKAEMDVEKTAEDTAEAGQWQPRQNYPDWSS